jgi:hypothetical protein
LRYAGNYRGFMWRIKHAVCLPHGGGKPLGRLPQAGGGYPVLGDSTGCISQKGEKGEVWVTENKNCSGGKRRADGYGKKASAVCFIRRDPSLLAGWTGTYNLPCHPPVFGLRVSKSGWGLRYAYWGVGGCFCFKPPGEQNIVIG